jgi:predicted glycoside hydrolase/deacetylase ChbG (UPF0249 family)
VVTADDLGLSPAVNAGVAAAHRRGVVTSTSLMVLRPAAAEAAAMVADLPGLSVGLHLELASFEVIDGSWRETGRVADPGDARAVADAVERQLDRFGELLGRAPDHIDSHHHLHDDDPVGSVVDRAAARLGVPVRGRGPWRYRGDFYGQWGAGRPWPDGITVPALLGVLDRLGPGITELACHPADTPHPSHGTYDAERVLELRTLTDPRVVEAVRARGIRLIRSCEVAAAQPKRPDT